MLQIFVESRNPYTGFFPLRGTFEAFAAPGGGCVKKALSKSYDCNYALDISVTLNPRLFTGAIPKIVLTAFLDFGGALTISAVISAKPLARNLAPDFLLIST